VAVRRLVAATVAVAAVVLLAGIAAGWWQGSSGAARPSDRITATAGLSSRSVGFGDRLNGRVDVLLDAREIDPASVRVLPRVGPYRVVSATLARSGSLLTFRYGIECLTQSCAPAQPEVEQRLQPALVTYRTRAGEPGFALAAWPSFKVYSRVSPADRAAPAQRLRYSDALPKPTYAHDPGGLRALLTALVVLLALAAAALAWLALRPARRERRRGPSLSPLERALAAVRASSANGHVAERRKALGWLGRELDAVEQPELADDAARLAWSADAPSPEAAGTFADGIEEREQ
jgi:hypothetical protein